MILLPALAVALVLTPLAGALATRVGLLDEPGPLKVHARPVPYLGGLAVLAAASVGVAATRPRLLVPLALAFALGLADDARPRSAGARLFGGLVIGGTTTAVVDVGVDEPLGTIALILVVVVLVNGVNMIDGLDGLAAGAGLASAAGFAVLLDGDGRTVALGLSGALAGFLVYNRAPARIYLGDAGSHVVGAALAVLLALAWEPGQPTEIGVGALLVVAFPVAEVLFAVVRRLRGGTPLRAGDRGHTYDRLVARGWAASRAAAAGMAAQALLALGGVGVSELSPPAAAGVIAAAAAGLLVAGGAAGFLAPTAPQERA